MLLMRQNIVHMATCNTNQIPKEEKKIFITWYINKQRTRDLGRINYIKGEVNELFVKDNKVNKRWKSYFGNCLVTSKIGIKVCNWRILGLWQIITTVLE